MSAIGRRPLLAALVLTSALLAIACTTPATPTVRLPPSVAIGLLTPKTGDKAPVGRDAIHGAELAIDIVNSAHPDLQLPLGPAAGLHNGVKLTLAVGDTQAAPERVEEQASRLVRDGAIGLVLADDLAVARAAGRQVDITGVAMIDSLSTADLFADLGRSGHFRIQPSDRSAVKTVMGLLFREQALGRPVDRVAVAAPASSSPYSEEAETIKKAIADLGQAGGYALAPVLTLGPGGASANDLVAGVLDSKPSVVLAIVTNAQDGAAAAELATKLKGSVPVVALGPGVSNVDVARAGQSDLLRATSWSADYARRNPVAAQVAQLYESRYGGKISEVAVSAFTATLALALAIDTAKGLTTREIRASAQQLTMSATQMVMPWDGIRFDGTGNNQLGALVVEQRTATGFQVVHPLELAAAALNWP